jgi:5S rRNA maturation endonuclease (ribonuclease M5)
MNIDTSLRNPMGWSREEVIELIDEWISDLNSIEGIPVIIVEGKRDIISLNELGVTTESMSLNKGLSMIGFVESMISGKGPFEDRPRYDRMVILTDWDRKGYRLSRSLEETCQSLQVLYDLDLRRRISVLTGKWIKDVESLPSLIRSLKREQRPSFV